MMGMMKTLPPVLLLLLLLLHAYNLILDFELFDAMMAGHLPVMMSCPSCSVMAPLVGFLLNKVGWVQVSLYVQVGGCNERWVGTNMRNLNFSRDAADCSSS